MNQTVPFVIIFESSSGSSWLLEQLGAHPSVCAVGYEPLDNITMGSASDHAARIQWLRTLFAPPLPPRESAAWTRWTQELLEASIFGQRERIRTSLGACDPQASSTFGLKARLSRLLTVPTALVELGWWLGAAGVRVIRLRRENIVQQALAEYRRLHSGKGQFVAAADAAAAGTATHVKLPLFATALRDVQRSRRLAERATAALAPRALLDLTYEAMLRRHVSAMTAVAAFLRVDAAPLVVPGGEQSGGRLRKASPERMCAAVANYEQFCNAYANTDWSTYFDEPCDVECTSS